MTGLRPLSVWDKRFLDLAQFVAQWSKDPSTKVGAVITDDRNRIVSLGFNGFPRGIADTDVRLTDREIKYQLVVHGERNAMLFANRPLVGCRLYTWPMQPCSQCAAMIIQLEISEVITYDTALPERWEKQLGFRLAREMLREAQVPLRYFAADLMENPDAVYQYGHNPNSGGSGRS